MYFTTPLFYEFEPRKVANVTENGNVANDFARFDAVCEMQCLNDVLGACLTKELIESFELLSGATVFTLKADATTPIKNLVNGLEYDAPAHDSNLVIDWWLHLYGDNCSCGCGTNTCTKRYWKGIAEKTVLPIGTIYNSFIADYVYYEHLLANRSITAGTGQQVLSGENSQTVQNFSKRIDAYNRFLLAVLKDLYPFLEANKIDYPTWVRNCNLNFKDKY